MEKHYKGKYRIPSARAVWHDYNDGSYFITICTEHRKYYFGKIIDKQMHLSPIGQRAKYCIEQIPAIHPYAKIPHYVIMPDHIHLIIVIIPQKNGNDNAAETPYYDVSAANPPSIKKSDKKSMRDIANCCGQLSHIISRFKWAVTQFAHKNELPFAWQARFHDHIIRNQTEMERIARYIENNVANWKK